MTLVLLGAAIAGAGTARADELGQRLRDHTVWITGSEQIEGWQVGAFRRDFDVSGTPRKAMVHVFAHTRYLLFVNGQYVCRGPNRYELTRPEYDSVDITALLKPGRNVVAIRVHRDWPDDAGKLARMRAHLPGFCAAVQWADEGGDKTLYSDGTWAGALDASFDPPRGRKYASIPESIDSRKWARNWFEPGVDTSAWGRCSPVDVTDPTQWPELWPRTIPMLRETPLKFSVNAPEGVVATGGGGYRISAGGKIIVRLDRIAQAYPVLDIDAGDAGATVVTNAGLKTTGASVFTLGPGKQRWMASDTQAVRDLTIEVTKGEAVIVPVSMVEVLYPFDLVGSFRCSDPLLEQVWAVAAKSTLLFSEDAYVDCADRERSEWMDCDPPIFDATRVMMAGPAVPGAAGPTWGDARLLKNLVLRVALTQVESGMTKARTCSDRMDVHTFMEDRACDWVEGIRKYYEATGDAEHVRLLWPYIVRQMQWFLDRRSADGLVRAREWIAWDNPLRYGTCEGTANNAFIQRALADAAYLGQRVGFDKDAQRLEAAAGELLTAISAVLWNERAGAYHAGKGKPELMQQDLRMRKEINLAVDANGLIEPTLHANLFALDRGVVPVERRKQVMEYVLGHDDQIREIMAQHFYFKLLDGLDAPEYDQRVLDRIRSGWKGMAEGPEQTTWEKTSGGSKMHVYGIVPGFTLSSYVLGVRRDSPVWEKRLTIDPRLGDLTFARGDVVSEFGPVWVSWERVQGKLKFEVRLPAGVTARLRLPDV